jgi:hypothetical protein
MNDDFDFEDNFEDSDFDEGDYEGDEFDGVDDDFGETSNHAEPDYDDVPDGFDWEDYFTLGMGLGYELGYGDRRRKRRDDDVF